MRTIIIAVCSILLSSCVTTSHYGQNSGNWVGKSASEMTAALGAPVLTNVRSNGNTTYTYVTKSVNAYAPPGNPQIGTIALPRGRAISVSAPADRMNVNSTLVECIKTYEANKQGVIVGVKTQGEGC